MTGSEQKKESSGRIPCGLQIAGFSITRIILWLIAITIVSFVLGFAILALSGGLPVESGQKMSPFRNSVFMAPNTTPIALDGAGYGDVQITMGAGEFTLQGGAPSDSLMVATVFSKAPEWQPDYTVSVNGTQKTVVMMDKGHNAREWVAVHSPNNWEVQLNEDVPLDLKVSVGAGDSRLILGAVTLTSLSVNNGAGDTEIDLGGYHGGPFMAEIHHGVGDLTLRVPSNSNTRISTHQGVGSIDNSGFAQYENTFTTVGYTPALPVNEILIEQGVGEISFVAV